MYSNEGGGKRQNKIKAQKEARTPPAETQAFPACRSSLLLVIMAEGM